MPRKFVVKKVDGMWEFWPRSNWFLRYFGFRQLDSTDDWIWVTRFETQAEAFAHAYGWCCGWRVCGSGSWPLGIEPTPRSGEERRARQMGYY